ncbi:MAG: mechanosensitive ion channel family protein [Pseudomonadota bacterium]
MDIDAISAAALDFDAMGALALSWAEAFVPRFVSALLLLTVGLFVASKVGSTVFRIATRSKRIGTTLPPILAALARYGITILVVVAVLGQLGVQTASILAALGAAGLAIGLALQGTLQNIAAGMMILWLRPFRVGDVIETDRVIGTVEELNLFHSQIRTWEGIYKFVPNSELWNTVLTNYTRNPTRLIRITFGIAYENDARQAIALLKGLAEAHEGVLADPPPQVVPLELAASSVNLELRAWAANPVFWDTRWELTVKGKAALEEAGITIPFPQVVIHRAVDGA